MTGKSTTPRRRDVGFTLVELLVVLVVCTFMMTAVAMALSTLLRAKDAMQDELTISTTVSRLAAQLRVDAHQADSIERTGEQEGAALGVRMGLADQRVDYRRESNRLIRRLYQDDEEHHREVFALPEDTNVQWELGEGTPSLVTLKITVTNDKQPEAAPRVHRVEAIVGLHAGATE